MVGCFGPHRTSPVRVIAGAAPLGIVVGANCLGKFHQLERDPDFGMALMIWVPVCLAGLDDEVFDAPLVVRRVLTEKIDQAEVIYLLRNRVEVCDLDLADLVRCRRIIPLTVDWQVKEAWHSFANIVVVHEAIPTVRARSAHVPAVSTVLVRPRLVPVWICCVL